MPGPAGHQVLVVRPPGDHLTSGLQRGELRDDDPARQRLALQDFHLPLQYLIHAADEPAASAAPRPYPRRLASHAVLALTGPTAPPRIATSCAVGLRLFLVSQTHVPTGQADHPIMCWRSVTSHDLAYAPYRRFYGRSLTSGR